MQNETAVQFYVWIIIRIKRWVSKKTEESKDQVGSSNDRIHSQYNFPYQGISLIRKLEEMETSVTGFKKWDALVAFLSCLVNFLSSCCPKQTLWVSAPSLYRIVPEDPIHTCWHWHKWEYPIPSLYIWLMSLVWVWIHIPFSFIIFCHWVHPPKWLSILILSPVQLLYFSNLWFFSTFLNH